MTKRKNKAGGKGSLAPQLGSSYLSSHESPFPTCPNCPGCPNCHYQSRWSVYSARWSRLRVLVVCGASLAGHGRTWQGPSFRNWILSEMEVKVVRQSLLPRRPRQAHFDYETKRRQAKKKKTNARNRPSWPSSPPWPSWQFVLFPSSSIPSSSLWHHLLCKKLGDTLWVPHELHTYIVLPYGVLVLLLPPLFSSTANQRPCSINRQLTCND